MTRPRDPWRRAYAEALREAGNLQSNRLVDAFADVPRERFLGPGPWLVVGGAPAGSPQAAQPRMTPTDDPRDVHQNVSVAIDASRALYNGQPGLVAGWIDALDIRSGDRILHIGCGTGYYSAILAEMTGHDGRVIAIETDKDLAARARENLRDAPWVHVLHGDGRTDLPAPIDVLLVHAGASHLLPEWIAVMHHHGRLLVPMTCTMPGMPETLSKGVVLTARRGADGWSAHLGSFVMIYPLVGLRDAAANAALGRALLAGDVASVNHLRPEPHEQEAGCWLHAGVCVGFRPQATGFREHIPRERLPEPEA